MCSHTLMKNQTAVLSVMYLTAIGYVTVVAGIFIDNASDSDRDYIYDYDIDVQLPEIEVPDYIKLLFAGGFLTTLFWVRDTIQHIIII